MAQQFDNDFTGIISKNDRKEKDSHPDIKGQCTVDGVEYWVSGWQKTRKDGSGRFYSLVFKAKDQQPSRATVSCTPGEDDDQDIPF